MTIREVAKLQECSERSVRRFCLTGYKDHVLPSVLVGVSRLIEIADFKKWRADCGFPPLPEPEPAVGVVAARCSDDLQKAEPQVLPRLVPQVAPDPDDLDGWTSEELEAARLKWMQPDNPNGPPTNQPAVGSGTRPSPENFARLTRANAILLERLASGQPRTTRRPATRFQLRTY